MLEEHDQPIIVIDKNSEEEREESLAFLKMYPDPFSGCLI